MVADFIKLVLLTLTPGLELRASIPYGLLIGMNLWFVLLVCIGFNIILGPIVFIMLHGFVDIFRKIGFIEKIYQKLVVRSRKKVHPYVEKYGFWGMSVFISIPLPGSGSYTGALAAYILGIDFKRFALANLVGVIIAGTLVTLVVLTGSSLFGVITKVI